MTPVLKSTVLEPTGESLKVLVECGRFIVTKGEVDRLMVQFSSSPDAMAQLKCAVYPLPLL
jgi:hypothetical protein